MNDRAWKENRAWVEQNAARLTPEELKSNRQAFREKYYVGPQVLRAIPRFFTVPEPRQRELERLPYDL